MVVTRGKGSREKKSKLNTGAPADEAATAVVAASEVAAATAGKAVAGAVSAEASQAAKSATTKDLFRTLESIAENKEHQQQ